MFVKNKKIEMKYYLIVLIVFFSALPSISMAEEGWTRKADMPTARYQFATSAVNGKIYAIGGRAGGPISTVEEYDPATDTWIRKADMPTGRFGLATCVVNGKIYAISGNEGSAGLTRAVEAYDPATDTWTKKADIPLTTIGPSAGVVNGKIYVIVARVQIYDPATDTWSVGAENPTPRSMPSVSAMDSKIYVMGGTSWDPPWASLSIVDEYDPVTDTWTRKADIPTPRRYLSTCAVNGIIYAVGGRLDDNNNTPVTTVEAYIPETDTWIEAPDMQIPRYHLSTCTLNGDIYAIGGNPRTGVVEMYSAGPWGFASNPSPTDGALHFDTWATLSWTPGDFAVSHDVYFSDNLEDVNTGTAEAFQGNQDEPFFIAGFAGFAYPEGLTQGTTYYWRVDEINDLHPESPWKGRVWKFTIPSKKAYEPFPSDGAESVDPNVELSWTAGFGATVHTVYFGENYNDVNNSMDGIPQAATTYVPGPLKPAKTYYWRIDEFTGGRDGGIYKGNVWTFSTTGAVGSAYPLNGATNVGMNSVLCWTPSEYAVSHQLYFGTDKDAVRNATAGSAEDKGSKALGDEKYDPGFLEPDTTYYWRVDEVDAQGNTSQGPLWIFTTGNFLLIDDFEVYTDDDAAGQAIWQTWIDGFGIANNGAQVGYLFPPFAEQTIVHGGSQAMPLLYANEAGVTYSEAVITLINPRDWTEQGVGELSLWFRGYPAGGTFIEEPVGTYTINAEGTRIGWKSDYCYFSYKALTGPGSIVARVDSIEDTLDYAVAAVMIRETLDPDSMSACAYLYASGLVGFHQRDSKGSSGVDTYQPGITAPRWLKLERDIYGTFRASHSADGFNWQPVENSAPASIPMRSDVYIGLAVASRVGSHTCEVVFSNVTITGTVSSEWISRDIGLSTNDAEPLYAAIANSGSEPTVVYYDDPAATNIDTWTEWIIPLQLFADQGVDLTRVDSIAIGLGLQGNTTTSGGSGKMYFDDIRLCRPVQK